MEFKIDNNKKKEITKVLINKNKYLRKANNASSIFMLLGYASLLFYFCFYSMSAQFNFKSFAVTTGLFVAFLILSTISKLSVLEVIKPDLLERTDEKLTMQAEEFIYSFRNKYTTSVDDRIRIHIPFKNITNVEYKKCKNKLIFTGNFVRKHAHNCGATVMPPHRGRIVSEKDINTFVLYDYFDPSLYDYLVMNDVGNFSIQNTCNCSPRKDV